MMRHFHVPLELLLILFFIFHSCLTIAQSVHDGKWVVEWTMDRREYKQMKKRTKEVAFLPSTLIINGQECPVEEIHTRGKTSLQFPRKSYTVTLYEPRQFHTDDDVHEMRKFYLLSMSMDKGYFRNRLALASLKKLGMMDLFHHYTEVRINGKTEGLYLLTARPADYALDDLMAPGVLRRGSTQFVVKQKYADEVTTEQEDACMAAFKEIASSLDKEGAALDSALRAHLDLDAYYEWLAFNYLVRNGDYTDEVFYYLQPDTEPVRFGIIPWDFDDILSQEPHETSEVRDRRFLDNQLIFSSEDPLDREIARDSFLYHDYLKTAKSVLEILDEAFIKSTFDQIRQELEVMVEDPDILKPSSQDLYPMVEVEDLTKEIRVTSNYLQTRVSLMYEKVQNQLNQP